MSLVLEPIGRVGYVVADINVHDCTINVSNKTPHSDGLRDKTKAKQAVFYLDEC